MKRVLTVTKCSSHQPVNVENMNLVGEMFRPISNRPATEAFHLTSATDMVALRALAFGEWFACEEIKNAKKLLSLPFCCRSKDVKDGVVNAVFAR